jgi:hypothetical protein
LREFDHECKAAAGDFDVECRNGAFVIAMTFLVLNLKVLFSGLIHSEKRTIFKK